MSKELVAWVRVRQVKSTVRAAFCWWYKCDQNMQQVSAELDEYEARFGPGNWRCGNGLGRILSVIR